MKDSLCTARFGACSMYEHRHCAAPDCAEILYADGDRGYENARVCTDCGDDFFLLCLPCAAIDSRCGACRAKVAA